MFTRSEPPIDLLTSCLFNDVAITYEDGSELVRSLYGLAQKLRMVDISATYPFLANAYPGFAEKMLPPIPQYVSCPNNSQTMTQRTSVT